MTREPFIAHSELTNEIYIVVGKEKYRVTEQAIKAVMAIKALEQESCEDAISRKAVLNTLDKMDSVLDENRTVETYKELLIACYNDLPPVTPTRKKGKWIGTYKIGFGEFAEYEVELIDGFVADNCHCSECGEELEKGERGIYCPNCGAKMVEPQESEDKE